MEKKKYKFTIDGKHGESETPTVTEERLRELGSVPKDYQIYREINGPGDDELVTGQADLSDPGRDKFYSSKPNTNNG